MRPTRLPHALTISECHALVGVCRDADLRALVAFLWASGCRINEALTLTWASVNCEERKAIVRGKGDKERVVFFDAGTAVLLRGLCPGAPTTGKGPPGLLWGKSRQAYGLRLASAARRAGIEGMHFHLLRHSFATQMLEAGANPIAVMDLMGHSKIDTLQTYAHITGPYLAALRDSIGALPRCARFTLAHPDSHDDIARRQRDL